MNRPEEQLHRAVAQYLDLVAPMNGWWWCHIPNGGGRSKAEAGIFKALGVKPGVADVLIVRQRVPYWIELKPPKGTLSDNQKKFRDDIQAQGCDYAVARSVDEVIALLEEWNLIRRAA